MNDQPIGIFDSGVGGTSIWKELHKLLPYEGTMYLADSKNAPYGERSKKEIIALSIKNTEFLLNHGCKLIVVACNTATTNAIDYLRKNYSVPFIGIEPAIKPAALQSLSKTVGVLATKGTLSSSLFNSTSEHHALGIKIMEQVGTGLVPLIEQGRVNDEETSLLLKKYMAPMLEAGIDYLVLGCTHYPYLIPVLKELLPSHIKIIDSGEAVAKQTKVVLEQNDLLTMATMASKHEFYTNTKAEVLKSFLPNDEALINIRHLDF